MVEEKKFFEDLGEVLVIVEIEIEMIFIDVVLESLGDVFWIYERVVDE